MAKQSRGYFATRAIQYNEETVEPGQLFRPRGAANDDALVRVGYLAEISDNFAGGIEEYPCVRCGKVFVGPDFKAVHDTKCPEQVLETDTVPGAEIAPELVGSAVTDL